MGIWSGGDSWQSKPWRHRGDNLPINRMHGRGICYRAISMPSARAQRDRRFKTSRPPASPIPGDELQLRLAAKHHQELPQQAPNSFVHSHILGRCFLKQLGSHQLRSWEGGNTAQGCSAKGTATSPRTPAEPNCLQTMGSEETKHTPAGNWYRPSHKTCANPLSERGSAEP